PDMLTVSLRRCRLFPPACPGAHRDLHSFPTRRSSDLDPARRTGKALVTFALPGEQITPTPLAAGGVVYPIALRLIATNARGESQDRKSTRLNSSHVKISYAVFCLKKKKNARTRTAH